MAIAIEKTKATFGRAAVLSGIIAGTVFLALEMILVPAFTGDSAWAPPRMIAAIILGRDVLPSPEIQPFNFGIVLVALLLHYTLSVLYSTIISAFCRMRSLGMAVAVGAAGGMALYVINFYGFTVLFSWFAMARNWISIISHLAFGMVVAYSFVKIYYPSPNGSIEGQA